MDSIFNKLGININQNVLVLLIGLTGLGFAEFYYLDTLFWITATISIITLATNITQFADELLNCIHRHKYAQEFIETAKAEFELHYNPTGVGKRVNFEENLLN